MFVNHDISSLVREKSGSTFDKPTFTYRYLQMGFAQVPVLEIRK